MSLLPGRATREGQCWRDKMRFLGTIFLAVFLAGLAAPAWAAETPGASPAATDHAGAAAAGEAAHGSHAGPVVSPHAPTLFSIGPLDITNSIVVTWAIGLLILVVVRLGTRNLQETPSGLQNLIETAVEGLEEMTSGLLEPKVARWAFPLVATYFLFILLSNLTDLLPGVGSIGWGHHDAESAFPWAVKHADIPWLRPPTADANMTVGMSAIFFVMCWVWAFRYNGLVGVVKHIFGVKGGMKGWIVAPLFLIFLFIGAIEVISICIRPVALAMRLYGNIYGGESVLTIMLTLAPLGLAAVPFYFLELIVAVVQALVFTLLSIAFISTLCSHSEDEAPEAH
jgi:F-type H+-transporting ATPase subunit a